jgi:CheY-like chemotaxis protein
VVEDDDSVREHARLALERVGCRVLAVSNGSAALEILSNGDGVDLLLSDVVMPGLSGPELVARAKEIRPGLRVLYTTGYTSDMALRHRLLEHGDDVLAKPYTPQDLYRKVRAVMNR